MMRFISFSGVQGSGKTTMMNEIYKKLNDVYGDELSIGKLSSVTRKLLVDLDINLCELRKNVDALKLWQYFSLQEHFSELMLMSMDYDVIVMDRCYIDFLVYTDMFVGKDFVEKLKSKFGRYMRWFDDNSVKFYLEPLDNLEMINDGVRDTSCYLDEVRSFEEWKDCFDFIVPSVSLDDRIYMVSEYIIDLFTWLDICEEYTR